MISFVMEGHDMAYEVQTAIQIFFPNKHYYPVDNIPDSGMAVKSVFKNGKSEAAFFENGVEVCSNSIEVPQNFSEREKKRFIKEPIYNMLSEYTGYVPKWGMITGVRPAKTAGELLEAGMNDEDIIKYFTEGYKTSYQKAALALNVYKAERKILDLNGPNDISLYIGIPFCPTRCLYCSFTSYPIDIYAKKADEYIEKLAIEMKFVSEAVKGRNIRSLYIGGGTPTSLSDEQFAVFMEHVAENFDVKNVGEFTVEAGRPDTITPDKLKAMKNSFVSRISINPQTMNQKTLDIIGRRHSVDDIRRAFFMARENGFENINMDIILGLPDEKTSDVENTMIQLEKLSPESITVHTLAVKRASRLKETINDYALTAAEEMERMIEISSNYAEKIELKPYYMYRQKAMLGNFENVGYAKDGFESVYNVEIMEERQSVIAMGAGGATKLYNPMKNEISRVFNVKSVDDYLARIDEMIERKRAAFIDKKF